MTPLECETHTKSICAPTNLKPHDPEPSIAEDDAFLLLEEVACGCAYGYARTYVQTYPQAASWKDRVRTSNPQARSDAHEGDDVQGKESRPSSNPHF